MNTSSDAITVTRLYRRRPPSRTRSAIERLLMWACTGIRHQGACHLLNGAFCRRRTHVRWHRFVQDVMRDREAL